jgi:hypothetical protein
MSKYTTNILVFIAGATVGSVATWYYMKKKYEEVEEYYEEEDISTDEEEEDISTDEEEENTSTDEKENDAEIKPQEASKLNVKKTNIFDYANKIKNENYSSYSNTESDSIVDEVNDEKLIMSDEAPYVITPEEFGEKDGYETITLLYYYNNDIVTDDNDEPVEDLEFTIGPSALDRFGEYEDDSVFVRNDKLKADFEILLDNRDYEDVQAHKPYLFK